MPLAAWCERLLPGELSSEDIGCDKVTVAVQMPMALPNPEVMVVFISGKNASPGYPDEATYWPTAT